MNSANRCFPEKESVQDGSISRAGWLLMKFLSSESLIAAAVVILMLALVALTA